MSPDADEYNKLAYTGLEALADLLDGDVAAYAPVPDERRPFLVGWGLAAALHRQAAAVVALHRLGFAHEAAPNRRLMVEYVAHLQWLVRDGEDAVDSMNKAFQYKHAKIREAADAAGHQYDAEAADAVRNAVVPGNPTNEYSSMKKLLDRLGGGLLPAWIGETQLSHATLTAAGCFYRQTEDSIELFGAPEYGVERDPTEMSPFIAFFFLFLGLTAFNDLLIGSPWTSRLRGIADAADLSGAI